MAEELSPEQIINIRNAIYGGNKIEAIKHYRDATGEDLKNSKDFIEHLTEELKTLDPSRFAKPRRSSGALAALVFWGTIALVVIYLAMNWRN